MLQPIITTTDEIMFPPWYDCLFLWLINRVRMILALGYWVLPNIFHYWVVLGIGQYFYWLWRSIQHNNATPLSRFLYFWNFTIGQTGSNMFFRISRNYKQFFAQNFCTDRVDILLCSERKKTRGFSSKFGTLAPWKYCGRRRRARARLRPRRVSYQYRYWQMKELKFKMKYNKQWY